MVLQQDLIRGRWLEEAKWYLTHELWYILAMSGRRDYMHYRTFMDDWDAANGLYQRILAAENFTPEGKPGIWIPIRDTKRYVWKESKDWRYFTCWKK